MLTILILSSIILAVGTGCSSSAASEGGRPTVAAFDVGRFMGVWYEIARFDHRFERGLEQVETRYELRPDGRISVWNSGVDERTGKRRSVRGKAHAGRRPGQLRVSFFWFFYSDYDVLALGEEYDWALIGSRSAKYLWILSRTPELPAETTERIVRQARELGYPVERLHFVDQTR